MKRKTKDPKRIKCFSSIFRASKVFYCCLFISIQINISSAQFCPYFTFTLFFFVWLPRSLCPNFYYAELLLWQWWFIDNFILIKMGISCASSRSLSIYFLLCVIVFFVVVVSWFAFPMIRQFLECVWWKRCLMTMNEFCTILFVNIIFICLEWRIVCDYLQSVSVVEHPVEHT